LRFELYNTLGFHPEVSKLQLDLKKFISPP